MNNLLQTAKKIVLFLLGIVLIAWGYTVNASSNELKAKEKDTTNNESETPTTKEQSAVENNSSDATSNQETKSYKEKKDLSETEKTKLSDKKDKNTKIGDGQTKTVIETATPEESSATE